MNNIDDATKHFNYLTNCQIISPTFIASPMIDNNKIVFIEKTPIFIDGFCKDLFLKKNIAKTNAAVEIK